MKSSDDQKIQEAIEKGLQDTGSPEDTRAYEMLFAVLAEEPDYRLPGGFEDQVMAEVLFKEEQRKSWRYFLFIGLTVAVSVAAAALVILIIGSETGKLALGFMGEHLKVILFAGLILLGIQVADYWLLKRPIED